MMNLDNYYIHATGGYKGRKDRKQKILEILLCKKIIPGYKNYGQSPDNEICLCDYNLHKERKTWNENAFDCFVLYSPSIIITNNLEVDKTYHCNHDDEVRYCGKIDESYWKFITFPIWPETKLRNLDIGFDVVENLEIFRRNIEIIERDFKTVPMKDIYTGQDITVDDVDKQIEVYQKKLG